VACGGSDPETSIEASTDTDQALGAAIVAELGTYNDTFDVAALPPDQQAEVGPIVDNLPQAAGGVDTLTVSGGVVEASTDFPADAQGAETGKLICGAIERSLGPRDPGGHRVLGAEGAVLAGCRPNDANFP
jgi:hypothetical protein